MSVRCPSCGRPPIGGQIVTLPKANGEAPDSDVYAVVCPDCGTVYQSSRAREQMKGEVGEPEFECPNCGVGENLVVSYIEEEVKECSSCGYEAES